MLGEAMLIDGIHIPLTVPFYRDGNSYLRKLEHNAGRYSLTPAAGLVVLGPGSEASALSDEETNEANVQASIPFCLKLRTACCPTRS